MVLQFARLDLIGSSQKYLMTFSSVCWTIYFIFENHL